jgi:hypothetical protein
VSLIDLKRAFRRLLARLPDESEAGRDFIVFSASGNSLDIVVGGTSEVLNATVDHPGHARIPYPVFRGIARSMRFHCDRVIVIAFSPGTFRIDRTDYRHPNISVLAPDAGQAIAGTKPAKLQNLQSFPHLPRWLPVCSSERSRWRGGRCRVGEGRGF